MFQDLRGLMAEMLNDSSFILVCRDFAGYCSGRTGACLGGSQSFVAVCSAV